MKTPLRFQRRRTRAPGGFTLMELLVVTAITGIFMAVTAPTLQEMLRAYATINTRQAQAATQDTWTNRLRADLWANHAVTIKSPDAPDIAIPGTGAPILWRIDTQSPITRTAAPDATGDTTKTFRPMAQSITFQRLPGALAITITQPQQSQPTLFTLPIHEGPKP